MHINRFISAHIDDMSRTNRFNVELHGPIIIIPDKDSPGLDGTKPVQIRMRGMRCTNVTIPGRTIGTKPHTINQGGPPRAHPHVVDYGGKLDLTFMLDTTFEDHRKIALWNQYVYNDAWGFKYHDSYKGKVVITQLDRQEWPIYKVELCEAWPSAFSAMPYDSAGGEAFQKFDCTIQYRTWKASYENSPTGLLDGLIKKMGKRIGTKVKDEIGDILYGNAHNDMPSKIAAKIFE